MIYLHKLLPLLFSPIVLVILFVGYGAFRRRRHPIVLGLALLYLASTPRVADCLFRQLEEHEIRSDPARLPVADAIVVLSGMLMDVEAAAGLAAEWMDPDRFFAGVELYKLGKSRTLIFTGGLLPWQMENAWSEGEWLKAYAETLGVPSEDIRVSGKVQNTEQEATAVKKLFAQENGESEEGTSRKAPLSILLVTSAFHMPRAQPIFERAGFHVVAYPVDFKVKAQTTTAMDFLPQARALWMTDLAVREWLGQAYYRGRLLSEGGREKLPEQRAR